MRLAARLVLLLGVLAATTLAGCALVSDNAVSVEFVNLTDGPASVDVDGTWVGTYEAGASADILLRGHEPPFVVTVRSPAGNSYTELRVTPEDVANAAGGTGGVSVTGHVPCGVVRLTVGRVDEPAPVPAIARQPCD